MIYTVKKGDTLTAIAKKYKVTLSALIKENGIINSNLIRVGQQLVIPAATATTTDGPDYGAIGKQVVTVISDIEKLASYKKLVEML